MIVQSVLRKASIAMSLLAGLIPLIANAAEQGVTDNEIVIGALGPLTGAVSFMGGAARDGIQLAVIKINDAGGINGRKLRIIFEHAFTPAESVAAAKKLVEGDKVFALVLASGSTGAAAAADYVRQTGIPTYNMFGATPIIREPFAKNVFHGAVPDPLGSAEKLIALARRSVPAAKKIGIMAGTYAFPQSNLKALEPRARAAGLEPVIEQFDQGARDFTAQLVSFTRQQVPVVIVLGTFTEAGFAIKQAPEIGLSKVAWVLDPSGVNDAIVQIIGADNTPSVIGYSNTPYFINQSAPVPAKFKEIWTTRFGQPPQGRPNLYDMIGYGDTYVLAEALQAAGRDLTWDGLIKAWSNITDARPSKFGGIDMIYPESFSETDHQGNKRLGTAIIKSGIWQVID